METFHWVIYVFGRAMLYTFSDNSWRRLAGAVGYAFSQRAVFLLVPVFAVLAADL